MMKEPLESSLVRYARSDTDSGHWVLTYSWVFRRHFLQQKSYG